VSAKIYKLLGVKKIQYIDFITNVDGGRLSPTAAAFLHQVTRCDPFDNANCCELEKLSIRDLMSNAAAQPVKGNLLGDNGKRWGTVYFYRGSAWNVRARISQKEGMEITQAFFLSTGAGFGNHRIHQFGFANKRSNCTFGPFMTTYRRSFAINALYEQDNGHHVLFQSCFRDNGLSVSRILESKTTRFPARFVYKLNFENVDLINCNGQHFLPKELPVNGCDLLTHPNNHFMTFEVEGRQCRAFGTHNQKWEFSLTKQEPDYRKNIPSTKSFPTHNSSKPAHLTCQVSQGIDPLEKRSLMLSFNDLLARSW
jgi:hypothetical protein